MSSSADKSVTQAKACAPLGRVLTVLALLIANPAFAQNVEFAQTSVPAGIVNQTTFPANGASVTTLAVPLTSGIYRFTHWTLNGVRQNNGSGSGRNPVPFTISVPTAAVANYLLTAQNTDGDVFPDWYEIHHFGDLAQTAEGDFDGDGFTNGLELSISQHPGVFDERVQGGISRRREQVINIAPGVGDPTFIYGGLSRRRSAAVTVIVAAGFVKLDEISSPVGILAQTRVLTAGATVNLFTAPATFSGHRFTGWLVNGARHDVPPRNQPIPITVTENTVAVARYILETADSDMDGIADWIEMYHFESLTNTLGSDPDSDDIPISVELFRGYSLLAKDLPEPGGTSRRRSVALEVSPAGNRVPFRLTSNPATILEQTSLVLIGSTQTVPDRTNHTASGFKFAGWDLNGVRMADPSGVALNQFSFVIAAPAVATSRYVNPSVDTDTDGILDWHEIFYYGSLDQNAASNTDSDDFTYAAEIFRNQSSRATDTLEQGGVARRRAAALLPVFFVPLNISPAVGVMSVNPITQTSARLSTTVNPFGSPTTAYFEYGLTVQYANQTATQNLGNGLSAQAMVADLSSLLPGTTYHFRLVATNGNGTTTSTNSIFQTSSNGYQAWATFHAVGAKGNDEDRDGLANLLEFATNSDPNRSSPPPATLVKAPTQLVFSYTRTRAALNDGCQFTVEWSNDLKAPWSVDGVVEGILSDNGTLQQITATIPLSPLGRRFVRLRVQD